MDVERKGIKVARKVLFNGEYFCLAVTIPHTVPQLRLAGPAGSRGKKHSAVYDFIFVALGRTDMRGNAVLKRSRAPPQHPADTS
jgi:hypothetical protein